MRTHHGAEPPPSQAERSWAREVRQLSEELQDAERGRPRLLEIAARLQQTRYDGGGNAPPLHAPLSAVGAARQPAQSAVLAVPIARLCTPPQGAPGGSGRLETPGAREAGSLGAQPLP